MARLKNITSPIKKEIKSNKNMTTNTCHNDFANLEIKNSVLRGELLRYAHINEDINKNLDNLKKSNPKYLDLIIKIIKISLTELPALDIDMHAKYGDSTVLSILLSQIKDSSYNNQEALDFTKEVIENADILTSKYYLAHLAGGILQNKNLKAQFKASIPFVKYILASISSTNYDLTKQKEFISALKIIINKNADSNKISLLPKIKYVIDNISNKNHVIDITKIVHNNVSHKIIEERLQTITKDIKTLENKGLNIDCNDYLLNPEFVIS